MSILKDVMTAAGTSLSTEVCMRCGCGKTTDTWEQDPNDGQRR